MVAALPRANHAAPGVAPLVPVQGGHVAVLLATYNGAPWLDQQLRSVAEQGWGRIDVWASDDGSEDDTLAVLGAWQGRWQKGEFGILAGEGGGFAENFRSLVLRAPVDAPYVAFCDQDDIWLPGKLDAAAAQLAGTGPALYCERTIIADSAGRETSRSPAFQRPPSFRNALVQNIAGGNTMVMNREAFELLREACGRTGFVSHDWFTYQLVTGAGGRVHYSLEPHVIYRQHGSNLVGANRGWPARAGRLKEAFRGRFVEWNTRNIAALEACRPLLDEAALASVELFSAARKGNIFNRLHLLKQSGVYRQTVAGQFSLYAACVMGKM